MSPYMEVGSIDPITYRQSRQVLKEAGKKFFHKALETFRKRQAEQAEKRLADLEGTKAADGRTIPEVASPRSVSPDRDPLKFADLGSQSLGTAGAQVELKPRPPPRLRSRQRSGSRKKLERRSHRATSADR